MFEWLWREIVEIKTNRFHAVDGPASEDMKVAVEGSTLPMPQSYKEFVLSFGRARLYRKLDYYLVGVLSAPRQEVTQGDEILYCFGHYGDSHAYFKEALLRDEQESPVFEGRGGTLVQVADGFESWLKRRCKAARKRYTESEWAKAVAGPTPFTAEEEKIIEARRQFTWHAAGVSSEGNLLLEVHNGSGMTLPFLSIGVRWKSRNLEGGIWLPISHVGPGQTAIVEHDTYRKLVNLSEIELFPKPDPEPEDRERYWEFRR